MIDQFDDRDRSLILIADDDEALLRALPDMLASRLPEVRVEVARSGSEAISLIVTRDYHAIVTDLNMPDVTGLDVLREAVRIRPLTPVIIMTGRGDEELAEQAFDLGAYLFVEKPFERESFVLAVSRALETYAIRHQALVPGLVPGIRALSGFIVCLEGLPSTFTTDDLQQLAKPYGRVIWTRMIHDANAGTAHIGYVEMAARADAERLRCALNGAPLRDQLLRVSLIEAEGDLLEK